MPKGPNVWTIHITNHHKADVRIRVSNSDFAYQQLFRPGIPVAYRSLKEIGGMLWEGFSWARNSICHFLYEALEQ